MALLDSRAISRVAAPYSAAAIVEAIPDNCAIVFAVPLDHIDGSAGLQRRWREATRASSRPAHPLAIRSDAQREPPP